MSSKYSIKDHQQPHFITFATVQWVDALSRPCTGLSLWQVEWHAGDLSLPNKWQVSASGRTSCNPFTGLSLWQVKWHVGDLSLPNKWQVF